MQCLSALFYLLLFFKALFIGTAQLGPIGLSDVCLSLFKTAGAGVPEMQSLGALFYLLLFSKAEVIGTTLLGPIGLSDVCLSLLKTALCR